MKPKFSSKPKKMRKLNVYAKLCKQINDFSKKRFDLGKELTPMIAPFKIGDIIRVRGYSHRGKNGRILEMSIIPLYNHIYLHVKAKVLKTDKKDSIYTADFEIPIFADGTIPTYEEEYPETKPIRITMDKL